ncbi:MAG: GSCFA domain-containing protein, partial [Bacteroidales bacterium]|nr:GSCFA domain-containing protein [Bacteroidales bacterium]
MIKLQTPVAETPCKCEISYGDRILLLGSCFSDNIGRTLLDYGFDALVNPFGTLYNSASVRSAVERLASGREFTATDCVPMGSGAGKICSFSHHTSFARSSEDEFLENANSALRSAAAFFRTCNKVIITLGTAWCYRYVGTDSKGSVCDRKCTDGNEVIDPSNDGKIVSNCLKRDAKEFVREKLSLAECVEALIYIIGVCSGKESPTIESSSVGTGEPMRPKDIIFTVSP